MSAPNSQTVVHGVCERIIGKGACKQCPPTVSTPYGAGTQGCYAQAEQIVEFVRQSGPHNTDAVLEELQSVSDDLNTHGHGLAAARVERRIYLLKGEVAPAAAVSEAGAERAAALEEAAKLVEYRGQCAVTMINTEERIEEKKAYAWDALQHGTAIRALKDKRSATDGSGK